MKRKIINVIIEQASDGCYWCQTEDEICGGFLSSTGKTVKEAKKDLIACFAEAKADLISQGKSVPNISFEYKYDIQSFFNYFNMLNASEIARHAGMSPSLMRQYTCGSKKAGEKIYKRLTESINAITTEIRSSVLSAAK